jgi:hypothetical protein
METERTQCQIFTSNKARNLQQWFTTFCISHLSAAETPANLSLVYISDSRMKGIAKRVSWNYVLLTPAAEHGIQNIQTAKQAFSCLQHRLEIIRGRHVLLP